MAAADESPEATGSWHTRELGELCLYGVAPRGAEVPRVGDIRTVRTVTGGVYTPRKMCGVGTSAMGLAAYWPLG